MTSSKNFLDVITFHPKRKPRKAYDFIRYRSYDSSNQRFKNNDKRQDKNVVHNTTSKIEG